jgi:hypothetical protein
LLVTTRWRGIARHEWTLACGGALALAVLMIWILPPMVLTVVSAGSTRTGFGDPVHTIIGDSADPTGQAWLLAWIGHALLAEPARLWDTNAFYPDRTGLAFNDTLLGYAPAGLIGDGVDAAVLRYNTVFVLVFALAALGAYALARQLGANRVGAAVAGAAFAYAPWRYGHEGHLNILSTGGIALALAMLARGHGWSLRHGYRPDRVRPGWAVAGWLVAAWQIALGFGVGLPFFYVLAGICLVAGAGWLVTGRPRLPRRLVLADLAGGLAFAAVSGAMAWTYLRVRADHPETLRSLDYVAVFSPPLRGYLIAPRSSLPWGAWHDPVRATLGEVPPEKALLCGYVLYALAVCGLVTSVWTVRQRLFLAAGVCWPAGSGRPPFPDFRSVAVRVVTVSLLIAVLAEGLPKMDHVGVPPAPAAMAEAPAPLIVLPPDDSSDLNVMLWSTDGFPVMTNGSSSVITPARQELRDLMRGFPNAPSVTRLRQLGIRSVVVVRDRVAGGPYEAALHASIDELGITRRTVGADLLYSI